MSDRAFSILSREPTGEDRQTIHDELVAYANLSDQDNISRLFLSHSIGNDNTSRAEGKAVITCDMTCCHGVLQLLSVRDDFRGLGIGKKLLNLSEDFAMRNGMILMRLTTSTHYNTGFYTHHGYSRQSDLPMTDSTGGASVHRLQAFAKVFE